MIGGGLVGASLAWGLAQAGANVALFDDGDDRFHASAGNFGLVWVQGKGLGAPDYAALTRRSAAAWDRFADDLHAATGADLHYRRTGGVKIALDDDELERFAADVRRMHNQHDEAANQTRVIDRQELQELLPAVGPKAVGGTWCPHDGHADPLGTLKALHTALVNHPKVHLIRAQVSVIRPQPGAGFRICADAEELRAERVVLAAGLGNAQLAPMVGLDAPVRPQRGQILVTERLDPFLDVACHTVRQTSDGTVLLGDSKEDVGFDTGITHSVATRIIGRAAQCFPRLAQARIVRIWGALRVMSPDGMPVYDSSAAYPGASLVTCHSGVTLAAAHAGEVAEAILAGSLTASYPTFSASRFKVAA